MEKEKKEESPTWVGPFGWVAGCLGFLYFVFDIKSGQALSALLYFVALGFISWMLVKNGLKLSIILFDKVYEAESSSSMKEKLGSLIVEAAQKKVGETNGKNPDPSDMDLEQMKAELARLHEIEKKQQEQEKKTA